MPKLPAIDVCYTKEFPSGDKERWESSMLDLCLKDCRVRICVCIVAGDFDFVDQKQTDLCASQDRVEHQRWVAVEGWIAQTGGVSCRTWG